MKLGKSFQTKNGRKIDPSGIQVGNIRRKTKIHIQNVFARKMFRFATVIIRVK